jgi:hypothetical protein
MENEIRCPCCLTAAASCIRIDKKGRPYLTCTACSSRTFIADRRGLAAILAAQPAIAQLIARAGGERVVQAEAAEVLDRATRRSG